MGNKQLEPSNNQQDHFIKPIKLSLESSLPEEGMPLEDITNQIEQVFGISNIPISHRANFAESVARSLNLSIKSEDNQVGKGKYYDERISNL